jgi:hypothetical protein
MTDEERDRGDAELENEDHWNFDTAEVRRGVVRSRAVVSVAFAREDFQRVSEYAELQGKRTSEFIREAALEKVARATLPLTTSSSSGVQLVATRLSTPSQMPVGSKTAVGV